MVTKVFRGGEKKPPRIVIYGPPKVGKTTFGSAAPAPIFVTTEDGVSNVPVDQYPKAESWDDVVNNLTEIAKGPHSFRSVVVDTLNGAAELCARKLCATLYGGRWEAQKGAEGFLSYGKGWAAVSEEMRQVLPLLDACRDRGMTVLLLAHTGLLNVKNPIYGEFQKFAPELDKRVWARFSAWADIIGRADYDYVVVGARPEEGKRGRAAGSNTRVLIFGGSAAEDAGCRVGYELPEQIGFMWEEFASLLGGKGTMVDSVRSGWSVLTPEEAGKTLAFLGVTSLEAIDSAAPQKLAQIANRLKAKSAAKAA